ncbi:MAG: ABC transporter ATP-binding protein [Bacilli bacterium]|nr:ABC transporter ATP-binding protein [Bacilli bacterium]
MENILSLKNVSFSFNKGRDNEVVALKGINLDVKKGSITVIRGVSGSGKTTLLNILDLLISHQSGEIAFEGVDVSTLSEREKANIRANKIGYIFQDYALLNKEKVKNNLELPLLFSEKYKTGRERNMRIDALLSALGIEEKKKEKVFRLSGGQRQRVAIARAIANDPDLLLADEPTSALDKKNKAMIIKLLKALNKKGKTIIIVTHDAEVAEAFGENYLLVDGKISKC